MKAAPLAEIAATADTLQKNAERMARDHEKLAARVDRLRRIKWSKKCPGGFHTRAELIAEIQVQQAHLDASFRTADAWHRQARRLAELVRKHLPAVARTLQLVKPYAENWITAPSTDWPQLRAELEAIAAATPPVAPRKRGRKALSRKEYQARVDYLETYGRKATMEHYDLTDDSVFTTWRQKAAGG